MQLELKLHRVRSEQLLQSYIERRLSFGLSRFNGRMGRVAARIGLSEGKAPAVMTCHFSADLRPFGVITAEASDNDIYTAIDRAAGRLARRCESKCARTSA